MPFTIKNELDAGFPDQAEPDAVDVDILVAGIAGDGVVSGCAVTAQGSPDMTCAVAAGVVRIAGAQATVTSGNVTISAANGTNPRFDLVVVNSSGTKSVTAGTAAANPVFPAIPASSVVLAAVYVPAADTTIASNQITDKRVTVNDDLKLAVLDLSSAQILALFGTPIQIIAAPGAGRVIGVVDVIAQLKFATTAYTSSGNNLQLQYLALTSDPIVSFPTTFITTSVSVVGLTPMLAVTAGQSQLENKAVVVALNNSNVTLGDSTIRVIARYTIGALA